MGAYEDLLEATIDHLGAQRARGQRHVTVSPGKIDALFTVVPEANAQLSGDDTSLDQLRQRALACSKCPNLISTRTQVVFGVGNPQADLMFVGEAPRQDEDRQGEPFVGAAGKLLTKIIGTMGLSRSDIYIANICSFKRNFKFIL